MPVPRRTSKLPTSSMQKPLLNQSNYKIHKNIFSADNNRKTSLEKSQSFCTKLAPIQDESITPVFTLVKPTRKQKLILPQPEIVLTSPLESPCTEPKKTDFLGIN